MKKILFYSLFVAFSITTSAQNIVQVGSGSVRQLCVGEGNRAFHKVDAKFCYYKPGGVVAKLDGESVG